MSQTVVKKSRKPSAVPRSADQPQTDCSAKPATEKQEASISPSLVDAAIAAVSRIKGVHPACAALPLIGQDCFDNLCDAIDAHGLLEAIRIDSNGLLLDGRGRLAACHTLGIEAKIEESSEDPWAIAHCNVARRHLNPGQRAVTATNLLEAERVAAKARKTAGLKKGAKSPECRNSGARGRADAIVARKVGVSADSIAKAKKLPEDLRAEVESGKQSLHAASKTAAIRAGKAIPKKSNGKSAKPHQAIPDSDGVVMEYQGHGITVYSHCGCETAGVVIRRRDGTWSVNATDLASGKKVASAEVAEAQIRKHLLQAARSSKQATSETDAQETGDS